MKKIVKKVLSFALALVLLCGLVVTSPSAAEENFSLKAYKEDGAELAASDNITEGEKVIIKLTANQDFTINGAQIYVWFNKSAFSYDTGVLSDIVKSEFSFKSINKPASYDGATAEEQSKLDAGNEAVWITLSSMGEDVTIAQGEWASMTFTALAPIEAGTFEVQIKQMLHTVDGNSETEMTGITAGSTDVTIKASEVAVDSVSLNKSELLIAKNKTETLTATVLPENATDPTVTWTSGDTTIATVTNKGKVKGIGIGSTTITATAGQKSAVCTVTVYEPVTKITLYAQNTTIKAGKTVAVSAVLEPENAYEADKILKWTSSNETVATVDTNGTVTGIGAGTATITATNQNNKKGTISITVVAVAQGDYTVSMADDISGISTGETVLVPVTIGSDNSEITAYNAYRMPISYDNTALEFVSAESSADSQQFSAEASDGVITVSDYGDSKNLKEAFVLKFNAIGGTDKTTVTVTEAQVDIGENAISENAAEASIINADTVITFSQVYTITLPDDYETDMSTTVEPDGTITFSIKDYSPYYTYTVSATMNGEAVTVVDNHNGTYTISNITGNVVVADLEKAGQSFNVTLPTDLSEVTGETIATYGTPYTFTIAEDSAYSYAVSIKIGDSVYDTPEPVDSVYTIPGDVITGDIVVSVTKTEKPVVYSVTVGEGAEGESTAPKGVNYTFTVKEAEDYTWEVSVTIGGVEYTGYTVNGNTYTIPGADVIGDIVITTTMGNKIYNVHFEQYNAAGNQNVTFRSDTVNNTSALEVNDTAEKGQNYSFIIGYKTGYAYELSVTMGGENIEPEKSNEYVPSNSAQTITYTINNVSGDIEIKVTRSFYGEVQIKEYVEMDGKTVFLVLASEYIKQNQPLRFTNDEGQEVQMITAQKYQSQMSTENPMVCAYLIIADASFDKDAFIENFMNTAYRNYMGAIALKDGYDVNGSGWVDINDAQLTYDIYTGKYDSFDVVTMIKFLQADVNADTKVNVTDAAAVVNAIQ